MSRKLSRPPSPALQSNPAFRSRSFSFRSPRILRPRVEKIKQIHPKTISGPNIAPSPINFAAFSPTYGAAKFGDGHTDDAHDRKRSKTTALKQPVHIAAHDPSPMSSGGLSSRTMGLPPLSLRHPIDRSRHEGHHIELWRQPARCGRANAHRVAGRLSHCPV